nr:MAG TPA: hypothetical protein [Caudoviricetes sp.]
MESMYPRLGCDITSARKKYLNLKDLSTFNKSKLQFRRLKSVQNPYLK